MPRLLSKTSTTKKSEAPIKKSEGRGLRTSMPRAVASSEPRVLSQRVETTSKPNPYFMEYQIMQFTASEYSKHIIRFGQRRMTRDEWEIWNDKKQREEKARYKEWREIKFGY